MPPQLQLYCHGYTDSMQLSLWKLAAVPCGLQQAHREPESCCRCLEPTHGKSFQLNFKIIFFPIDFYLTYTKKICTPGGFFQKTVSVYFAYMHRRNTLNKLAPLTVSLSGCCCNELSFFSHSCLPMDFFCFLQGI